MIVLHARGAIQEKNVMDAIRSKYTDAVWSADVDAIPTIFGSGMAAAYQRIKTDRLISGRGATTRPYGLSAGCSHRHADSKRAPVTLGDGT